ncbi:heavy-metal-associated domain-containing protein [Clostridium sp. LY3-2]|uniref:heavy-metal-associated domain-containing protein n=1 Tax=Clostridium sp. LY3-2 TaxID=2942482 RepID=UPI0021537D1D|nr:heavy-metal-associated domain-containing protein [Clostridium sp. LY3-2]MCR6516246.1 heavy-metal-associated domain-containing protein [Clostridium sp. LY3-2]
MKALLRVAGLNSSNDVKKIQGAIASNAGVIASELNLSKKEVVVIFNELYLKEDDIIDSIENLGYTVI